MLSIGKHNLDLNSPPIFETSLKSLEMVEWQSISYILPSVYDPENDNYIIIATRYKDGGTLPSWIAFDSRKFTIVPPQGVASGSVCF